MIEIEVYEDCPCWSCSRRASVLDKIAFNWARKAKNTEKTSLEQITKFVIEAEISNQENEANELGVEYITVSWVSRTDHTGFVINENIIMSTRKSFLKGLNKNFTVRGRVYQ